MFIKESRRQIIYSGIIAFVVFIIPLIFDWFGIETINLFILPYLVNRLTKVGAAAGLGSQFIAFLIGWLVFFIILLIIKQSRTTD